MKKERRECVFLACDICGVESCERYKPNRDGEPMIKSEAYLYRIGKFNPEISVMVDVPADDPEKAKLIAAHALLEKYRIELVNEPLKNVNDG